MRPSTKVVATGLFLVVQVPLPFVTLQVFTLQRRGVWS